MIRRKERTVGDVIRAAVAQGREVDFSFRPLTAAERRKGNKRLEAEVFGPVLEQLGLLSEEEMMAHKSKVTKATLVADLAAARMEIAKLRVRIVELELAAAAVDSIEVQVDKAARVLAEQCVRTVNQRCGRSPGEDSATSYEDREGLVQALRALAGAQRSALVLHTSKGIEGFLGGSMADREMCVMFVQILDNIREQAAKEGADKFGLADFLSGVVHQTTRGGWRMEPKQ